MRASRTPKPTEATSLWHQSEVNQAKTSTFSYSSLHHTPAHANISRFGDIVRGAQPIARGTSRRIWWSRISKHIEVCRDMWMPHKKKVNRITLNTLDASAIDLDSLIGDTGWLHPKKNPYIGFGFRRRNREMCALRGITHSQKEIASGSFSLPFCDSSIDQRRRLYGLVSFNGDSIRVRTFPRGM